jgi:hypothetical protein
MTTHSKTTKIDSALQAQVDAQLMEQGAFAALELLISSGRLIYSDYESWRRREIDLLDSVLMGNTEKIRAQLEETIGYARSIGLVEQEQEFYAWHTDAQASSDKPLRISADPKLHRLIGSRYIPARSAPQMDLFFDNPVVALTNGIVRALSARNMSEAQRLLDRLYAQAPNHADLAAFDRLLVAMGHLHHGIDDPGRELEFLLQITPTAKRLLGSQSRDLLAPLWRQLANALEGRIFSPDQPTLHRSFALTQAQDWPGVSESVFKESEWWRQAQLCLYVAQSGFYRQRRSEALTAWFHLCWRSPEQAADVLDNRRQPDAGITALWQRFFDAEEDSSEPEESTEPPLTAADFPAWMLLHEPGLAQQLAVDLPTGTTPGEEHYRCVHNWVQARRANRQDEEMELRKKLRMEHPALFRYLKRIVVASYS